MTYRTIKNFTQKVNDEEEDMDEFQSPLKRAKKRARKELKPENQTIDKYKDKHISKQNVCDVFKNDEIQSSHINNYSSFREPTDKEIPQKNEEKTETEKELDINCIENPSHISVNIITDILENSIEFSNVTKEIFSTYKEQCSNGNLIDLQLTSPFLKTLSKPIAKLYLKEIDAITESLISTNVYEFLVNFFSQDLTAKELNYQIDDL
ncbi:hypothetical protein Glove_44g34 [Diversispora epigaea]|uniref:Uncharacterized protein n=1 Tax=Diversispora epigaea TaxID=1348612 RepID=A0A397JQQ0_9GLOM|nr:hypothetical protein Glove_44g34 [Diversispora epigaea]